ncbi:MAG: hypothetical protein ABFQ65_01900 [Nanoarchaeota archaeon]
MVKIFKKAQIGYFTFVMLIFIMFAFFGVFLVQDSILTGKVITDVDLPENCDNIEIEAVWDSIFQESSSDISILKSDTLIGGKCAEYFANKSDPNEVNFIYILYGYTQEENGENINYVFAEKFNATDDYIILLNSIVSIEDVASISLRDGIFLDNYVIPRAINITSSMEAETEFDSVFVTSGISLTADTFFGDESFSFTEDLSTEIINISNKGLVTANYSYNFFSFISKAIECTLDINCESWSICINETQNRTCINSTCEGDFSYIEIQDCSISTCVINWSSGNWSDCINGSQTRTVIDLNNCENNAGKPAVSKSCEVCVPNWSSGNWSDCIEGLQIRIVNDLMNCGDDAEKPITNKSCGITSTSTPESSSGPNSKTGYDFFFIFVVLIIVFIILGIIVWILFLVKKKDESGSNNYGNKSFPKNPPSPSIPTKHFKVPLRKKVVAPKKRIISNKFAKPASKSVWNDLQKISKKSYPQKSMKKSFPRFVPKKVSPIPVKRNFGK